MADQEVTYMVIDAQAGIADVEVVIGVDKAISVTLGDLAASGAGLQLGETSDTAYRGDRGKIAYDHSQEPHAELNEPQFNQWLSTAPLDGFLTDAPSDGNNYARKNGTWAIIADQVVYVDSVIAEQDSYFPITYLKYTKDGNTVAVTDIPKANGIIAGGRVVWIENYDFAVSATAYYLEGTLYTVSSDVVSLSASDPTNPRIDLIAVDITGNVIVLEGTPSPNPQRPTVDPTLQIELTEVLVLAGSTEPLNIDTEVVYDENAEWTGSQSGTTVNFASTNEFFNGTMSTEVTTIDDGDTITYTASSPILASNYSTFLVFIYLKESMGNKENILVSCYDNLTQVSGTIPLGIEKDVVDAWQSVILDVGAMQFSSPSFDKVVFEWRNQNAQTHGGFYLDFIKFEKGIFQYLNIDESDPIFSAWKETMQATDNMMDAGTDQTHVATPYNLKQADFQRIYVSSTPPADTTKLWFKITTSTTTTTSSTTTTTTTT